jgi:hypothetical protein
MLNNFTQLLQNCTKCYTTSQIITKRKLTTLYTHWTKLYTFFTKLYKIKHSTTVYNTIRNFTQLYKTNIHKCTKLHKTWQNSSKLRKHKRQSATFVVHNCSNNFTRRYKLLKKKQTKTKLYQTIYIYIFFKTQFYKQNHYIQTNFTQIYAILQNFTKLHKKYANDYKTIQKLHNTSRNYTNLYKTQ